jgi:hypothetical protein
VCAWYPRKKTFAAQVFGKSFKGRLQSRESGSAYEFLRPWELDKNTISSTEHSGGMIMNALKIVGALFASLAAIYAADKSFKDPELQCFSGTETTAPEFQGYGGTCELLNGGCALLDTTELGPNGSFAGVYLTPLPGKPLNAVNKMSFTYTLESGTISDFSPRFTIPIDEDRDGDTEDFAYIGAEGCNEVGEPVGSVGLDCPVFYNDVWYDNWASFAEANPTFRFATDIQPFVIAQNNFRGTICNVEFGRAAVKK